jgi:type IV pilus assembly protein PilA
MWGAEKGFTLIELLIVVTIIGILASIAIPQFNAYRDKVYHVTAQSDLKSMRVDLEAYYVENFHFPY